MFRTALPLGLSLVLCLTACAAPSRDSAESDSAPTAVPRTDPNTASGAPDRPEDDRETPATVPSPSAPVLDPAEVRAKLQGPGLDVSYHSGAVDWSEVHSEGYGYAFVKATEGVDLRDPQFADHWRELADTGLLRGAYHFYVTEDDPVEQARFFLETVEFVPGDLVPVVDLELVGHGTEPGWTDGFRVWLETVEEALGVRPIIYTSPNFWNRHFDASFGEYPLWIAEYGVDSPTLPEGWDVWHFWQWRGDQAVPGIEKTADWSRGNPSLEEYESLLIPRKP